MSRSYFGGEHNHDDENGYSETNSESKDCFNGDAKETEDRYVEDEIVRYTDIVA